jgi:membrane protease YdiL (CAAX protease family)
MATIKAFIKRYPVLTYFALTFAVSWGGVLILVVPSGIPGTTEQSNTLFPVVYLAMLVGPVLAGILLTGLVYGRAGLREFRSRLLRWRVGTRWYATALLTAPLLMTATLFALSLLSPEFLPGILTTEDKANLLLFGITVGLGAGLFEELGWTGFAVPELRRRYAVLTTGLIVGFLWGAWHFLVYFWGSGDSSGAFSLALFLPTVPVFVGILPAYRVLMVWVYDRTGSLLVAILMHASLTASTQILMPLATGMPSLIYSLVLTAALWVVVAAVAVANGGIISRPPLRRQVA